MNWPVLLWGAYGLGAVLFFVLAMPFAMERRMSDDPFDFAMTTIVCALVSTMWLLMLDGGLVFMGAAEIGRRFAKQRVSR